MTTGVNYNGHRDGNNNVSYYYALTDTMRSLSMGSLLWTGVKRADQTTGSGTNLSLTVTNQSGLDRLRYGWGLNATHGGGANQKWNRN
jgi:hypothetical protein